jgi:predicted ATP-grasp superfamily ATP-dependent carboligase
MKQKVAVAIGTGDEQSYFINLAKKLGFFVIGFDKSINSKGSSICDVFYPICISDVDKIINTLEKYKPEFVIPSPIGKRLTTVGLIHDYFQINSFNHFATESVTNKLIFSQLLKRLNIPHPQTRIFQDIDQIIANFDQIDFPVIAKPNEGSGSRGVFIIKNKNSILDFKNYYNQNKEFYKSGILIQSYIDGSDIGVDGLFLNNKIININLRKKFLNKSTYPLEIGYLAPFFISNDIYQSLINSLNSVLKELNVKSCVFHADIITVKKKAYIIEMSFRPSGMNISSVLLPECLRINYCKHYMMHFICDDELLFSEKNHYRYQNSKFDRYYVMDYFFCDSYINKRVRFPTFDKICQLFQIYKLEIPKNGILEIHEPITSLQMLKNGFMIYETNLDCDQIDVNRHRFYSLFKEI